MIDKKTARRVLHDLYEIDAEMTPLYSELDHNFLAVSQDGQKRVFKIMHEGCSEDRVDIQYRAMEHLSGLGHDLVLPRVIPAVNGEPYKTAEFEGTERLVWLLRYCPGTLLMDHAPQTEDLMRSFGRTMGLVDARLRSFTHPAMRPGHKWELTRAGMARIHIRHVGADAAPLVDAVLRRFERVVSGRLASLRHGVIHNDANQSNVLVSVSEDGRAAVNGLIDFGDMSYQPAICEVAIALAYAITDKPEPLAVCSAFLEGYCDVAEIHDDDLAVLLDLIKTRLAVTIAIGAAVRHQDPDDALGREDKTPHIRALRRLAGISPALAVQAFRRACNLSTANDTGARLH